MLHYFPPITEANDIENIKEYNVKLIIKAISF